MKNTQPIEKYVDSDGQTLDVHSIFYTIQGEGPHTGTPAVFIRLAGCNLQCPGCDTNYTTDRKILTIAQILGEVEYAYGNCSNIRPLIVITGGEPFRQNLSPLVLALSKLYKVQIETNGTLPISPLWDFGISVDIVCSPKTGKVSQSIICSAKWFKYVLHHESVNPDDGLPFTALGHTASPQLFRPPSNAKVYLQPMDCQDSTTNKLNETAVLNSCLKHGHTLQLQLHKFLGVE